ncbi:MAG: hypothetical protein GYB33_04845 [Gammaproteobacteria bacterium]|nr:hypothetical protein [Gammaproteobacteria bacterium]
MKHINPRRIALVAIPVSALALGLLWAHSNTVPNTTVAPVKNLTPATLVKQPPATAAIPPVAAHDEQAAAHLSSLQAEVRELRDIVAELVDYQGEAQHDLARLQAEVDIAPPVKPVDDDTTVPSAEAVEAELYSRQILMEELLNNQAVDVPWAETTLSRVKSGFEHEQLTGFNLKESRCGSSLCKLEVSIDPKLTPEEGLQRLSTHRSWDGATFVKANASGQTELYFAREGHPLPQ